LSDLLGTAAEVECSVAKLIFGERIMRPLQLEKPWSCPENGRKRKQANDLLEIE
jgi:hypothetical protein